MIPFTCSILYEDEVHIGFELRVCLKMIDQIIVEQFTKMIYVLKMSTITLL